MKKLIIMLIFSAVLVFVGISGQNLQKSKGIHELYIANDTQLADIENVKITETGTFKIVTCDDKHYDEVRASIPDILGESVTYKTDKEAIERFARSHLVTIYDDKEGNGTREVYGYSPLLKDAVVHNGRLVNMHINYGNNTIKIGTPLIMGSY